MLLPFRKYSSNFGTLKYDSNLNCTLEKYYWVDTVHLIIIICIR